MKARSLLTASLAAAPLAGLLGLALPAASASTSKASATPTSVLKAAKAAIAKQSSVHLKVISHSASTTNTVVADLGAKNGTETITTGSATVTVRLTTKFGYISGNASGLTTIVGLTSAQAKKVGKDWMTLKAGTSEYSNIKSGTTFAVVAGVLPAAKGTRLSSTTKGGVKLSLLTWTTKATSSTPKLTNTLTLAATGPTLPVQETTSASTGSGTTSFSKWGERFAVADPPASKTISYTKVAG